MNEVKPRHFMSRNRLLLLFSVLGLLTINLGSAASGPSKTFASADLTVGTGAVDNNDVQFFLLAVTNKGSDTAQNVVFTLPLPEGSLFYRVIGGSQMRCNTPPSLQRGDVICSLGDVPPNGSVSIGVEVRYTAPGGTRISTQASVSSDTFDSDASNNTFPIDFVLPPVAKLDSIKVLRDPFRIEITGINLLSPRLIGIGCDCNFLPEELVQSSAGAESRVILLAGNKLKQLFPKGVPTQICYWDIFYSTFIKTELTR